MAWHRPLADDASPEDTAPFSTVIREGELLGVPARGALSPLGAHLVAHADEELDNTARRLRAFDLELFESKGNYRR
ncbi:hypothetical protein QA811_14840 [Streptomyces sp. B21-102]|uniref:hypothetical protein n=1 Tax=Streptomyces sp. B21-102 TaxID=3039416 RepID=UPI002FF4021F